MIQYFQVFEYFSQKEKKKPSSLEYSNISSSILILFKYSDTFQICPISILKLFQIRIRGKNIGNVHALYLPNPKHSKLIKDSKYNLIEIQQEWNSWKLREVWFDCFLFLFLLKIKNSDKNVFGWISVFIFS